MIRTMVRIELTITKGLSIEESFKVAEKLKELNGIVDSTKIVVIHNDLGTLNFSVEKLK